MHIRPRCREWLPLISQQLRLRNLVRVQALNIETSFGYHALVYYTLHHTQHDTEFYRSESLPARQQQIKWADITSTELIKSNLNCVCVKVWEQLPTADESPSCSQISEKQMKAGERQISALTHQLAGSCLSPHSLLRPPDKLLFTWGVYFSGLIPLHPQLEPKCLPNALIFQLNGDLFASPQHFTLQSLHKQLALTYERYSGSVPQQGAPIPDEFAINSPKVSRSSSPTGYLAAADSKNESQTACNSDLLTMSKARYIELDCTRSEIRRSYDLNKLLEMQKLQRMRVQNMHEALELGDEIRQQCVRCITAQQLTRKQRTTSSSIAAQQHHSMGRALSLLLAEQQQRDPHALLRAQQLQQQIESLRCKQRLLQSEADTYNARNLQLRKRLTEHVEAREQLQQSLHQRQAQLQADAAQLQQQALETHTELQAKRHVMQNVERRMSSLCMELCEIYPIGRDQHDLYTICDIPFPNMVEYLHDARYISTQNRQITSMSLSAALGYVAHLVQMIAVIINRPLRNPIHYEGSRTRIVDMVKDLPHTSREFPLYSRSTIPSKQVKYAIYLLHQNIAQLCYDITGRRGDLRATIKNILHIFGTFAKIEQTREIHPTHLRTHPNQRLSLQSGGAQQPLVECLSKSHSSMDLNNVPSSIPLPIVERTVPQQRICRSVGSYSDCEDDFKDINDHCYSNSDSNILNQSFAN